MAPDGRLLVADSRGNAIDVLPQPVRARLASLRPVIGLLLTVLFLVLALQRVDLGGFVDELRGVNYVWLLPSAVCTLVGYVLRTVRWRVILSGAARAPLRTLFPVLIMGFATNNLLPGRLGEFWRAYLLGRKRNVPQDVRPGVGRRRARLRWADADRAAGAGVARASSCRAGAARSS